MDKSDKEYIRKAFADLTGLFEDVSLMAAEGQSSHLTARVSGGIIRNIEKVMTVSEKLLEEIKHRTE